MNQLNALWDVVADSAGRLVYLWTCAEMLSAEEALLCNLVVMMAAIPPGRYPHSVARSWHQLGFSCDEAREWIRAGVLDPEAASLQKASGFSANELRTQPRIVAVG